MSRTKPADQEVVGILPTDTLIIDTGAEAKIPDERIATESASEPTAEVVETEAI